MAGFDVDVSEVLALAGDMRDASEQLVGQIRPAIAQSAGNVKDAMRDDMAASRHFRPVAGSITYDTRLGVTWAEAEIGPVTAGATVGDLAHIAYFGGAHGGGGTVRDPIDAANDEAPALERAITAIIGDILR